MLSYYDVCDITYKEELILKIAILTETYSPSLNWYIDIIINVVSKSEQYVPDEIIY